jgi:hypothetical protein
MGILVPLFGKFEASPNDFCRMQRSEGEKAKGEKAKKETNKGLSALFAVSPLRLFPLFFKKRKRGL